MKIVEISTADFLTLDRIVSQCHSLEYSCHTFQTFLRDGVTFVGNLHCYNGDRSVGTSCFIMTDCCWESPPRDVLPTTRITMLCFCAFSQYLQAKDHEATHDCLLPYPYISFVSAFLSHWHCILCDRRNSNSVVHNERINE